MRGARRFLAITLSAFGLASAFNQSGHADPNAAASPTSTIQTVAASGPTARSAVGAMSNIQVSTANAANTATLNLAGYMPNIFGASSPMNWSIAASSPISMGSSTSGGSSATNTDIATLDGLANGFSLKLKLSSFVFTSPMLQPGAVNYPQAQGIIARATAKRSAQMATNGKDCIKETNKANENDLVAECDPAEYGDWYADENGGGAITYGVQAAIGYNSFTVYNASSLAKSNQNDVPRSAKLFFGVMPTVAQLRLPAPAGSDLGMINLITFAAEYQQSYTAAATATKCPKTSSQAVLSCVTGAFSAPKKTDKTLLSVDWHGLFYLNQKPIIGVDPQFTYDTIAKTSGIDVPVYFVSGDKGALVGGLDAGWVSKTHDFSIGFFIGAPFSLLGS